MKIFIRFASIGIFRTIFFVIIPVGLFFSNNVIAQCNGGITVTGLLVVSSSCDGRNIKGLTLDTGANVTINTGITVSNDAPSGSSGRAVVVLSTSTEANLINNGTISTGNQWGLWTQSGSQVNVINTGAITASVRYGISNQGTINSLTNVGRITGPFSSIGNASTPTGIGVFNNLQGRNLLASNPVTLAGYLPTQYNIIIRDADRYGVLSAPGSPGTMAFNIYGNSGTTLVSGVGASTVVANRYLNVLTGFTSLSNVTGTTGTYGGYTYSLVSNVALANGWDLLVATPPSTDINTGTSVALSTVGTTSNPVFNGGTLTTTNGESSSSPFTVNAGSGTITSPTVGSVTFSGGFAGGGAMTYNGTGTTYMNGINTYAGGTTVSSGTLSVGSDEANKTASLDGDVAVTAAGTLAGHGSIGGSVSNSGKVAPGGSIGTLTVNGNYVQSSSATLMTTITPTENSALAVTGTAALAGTFQIDAESGSYTKRRYTVLTSSGLSGTFSNLTGNLANYSTLNAGLSYDANNAYLTLYAGTADTQQSIVNTASALQPIYTLQNTVLANSFAYDCSLFGKEGVCISAGGRNTAVQAANGLNNTSGLLIASYRLDKNNSRIGAYADQNLSVNNADSTVTLGNNTPLVGLFGVWSERADDIGAEVKVSAAYGQKDTTITRQVVGTSDPGSGSSTLNSQGAQVTVKYGFTVTDKTLVSPYVGIRYTQNNMGGYTEGTSSTVTAPLTYSALNTNATTTLAGVGASYKVIPTVTAFASAGVETDTSTANGSCSATSSSISGLTPVNFNANPVKTRPTATLGAYYDMAKNQRLGITGIYRQEAYQAVSTTTVMATYTVGL
jgi:hypothetical protein